VNNNLAIPLARVATSKEILRDEWHQNQGPLRGVDRRTSVGCGGCGAGPRGSRRGSRTRRAGRRRAGAGRSDDSRSNDSW